MIRKITCAVVFALMLASTSLEAQWEAAVDLGMAAGWNVQQQVLSYAPPQQQLSFFPALHLRRRIGDRQMLDLSAGVLSRTRYFLDNTQNRDVRQVEGIISTRSQWNRIWQQDSGLRVLWGTGLYAEWVRQRYFQYRPGEPPLGGIYAELENLPYVRAGIGAEFELSAPVGSGTRGALFVRTDADLLVTDDRPRENRYVTLSFGLRAAFGWGGR